MRQSVSASFSKDVKRAESEFR